MFGHQRSVSGDSPHGLADLTQASHYSAPYPCAHQHNTAMPGSVSSRREASLETSCDTDVSLLSTQDSWDKGISSEEAQTLRMQGPAERWQEHSAPHLPLQQQQQQQWKQQQQQQHQQQQWQQQQYRMDGSSTHSALRQDQSMARHTAQEPLPDALDDMMQNASGDCQPAASLGKAVPMNSFVHTARTDGTRGQANMGPAGWPTTDPLAGHPRYQRLGNISRGSSGFVMLALDRVTLQHVAVKFIPTGPCFKVASIQRELTNQTMCSGHPYIVQLLDVFFLPKYLAIVMEYANSSDLAAFISDYVNCHGRGLPEHEARRLLQQLLVALQFVHDKGIANRDIKLDNILLHEDPTSPGVPIIKLCDFGFSKNERQSLSKTSCGTPEYIAPEVLSTWQYDGKMSDVWGCGVVLYVLLAGAFPFLLMGEEALPPLQRLNAMMPRIISGRPVGLPNPVSSSCAELLRGLLVPNPSLRFTMSQALRHPWVTAQMSLQLAILNMRLQALPGTAQVGSRMPPTWQDAVDQAAAVSVSSSGSATRLHVMRSLQNLQAGLHRGSVCSSDTSAAPNRSSRAEVASSAQGFTASEPQGVQPASSYAASGGPLSHKGAS